MGRLTIARNRTLNAAGNSPSCTGDGDGLICGRAVRRKSWNSASPNQGAALHIGLGPCPLVSLARRARRGDLTTGRPIRAGGDPLADRARSRKVRHSGSGRSRHAIMRTLARLENRSQLGRQFTATPFPGAGECRRPDYAGGRSGLSHPSGRRAETARKVRIPGRQVMQWASKRTAMSTANARARQSAVRFPSSCEKQEPRAALCRDRRGARPVCQQHGFRKRPNLLAIRRSHACATAKRRATWAEMDMDRLDDPEQAQRRRGIPDYRYRPKPSAVLQAAANWRTAAGLVFSSPDKPGNCPFGQTPIFSLCWRRSGLAERNNGSPSPTSFRTWAEKQTARPHAGQGIVHLVTSRRGP